MVVKKIKENKKEMDEIIRTRGRRGKKKMRQNMDPKQEKITRRTTISQNKPSIGAQF
jgi:hypothetical protein